MSVIDYAASGNTSVSGISIATGMAPSSVDNAMRKIIDDIGEGLANGYFATALPATKSAGYTVLTTDRGKLFNCTSALTLALPAAATAAAGFMFWVKANGAAVILDPNAAELIDGAATVTIASGSSAFVVCTGTAWVTAFVATSYDWAAAVVAASAKATPIDADSIGLVDSAAANVLKETTIGELRTVFLAGTPTLSTIEGLSLVAGDTLYSTGADTITRLAKGTAAQVLTMNAGATAPEWQTVSTSLAPTAVLEDQKAAGTDGGTFTSGAWQTRTLNTEVYDPSGVMGLASNEFTPTVNGWVEWSAVAYQAENHKTRLYNVTGAAIVGYGMSAQADNAVEVPTTSDGGGPVAAGVTYRIEHRCSLTGATSGFGVAQGTGTEVYCRVKFWRS